MGASAKAALFTQGDLVVERVGDGSVAPTSAGTAVFLDEYSTAGGSSPAVTVALPTTASGGNNPIVNSGTATSEGELTLSANGQLLVVAGYDATVGTTGVASSATTSVPREVGTVDANGNVVINTTTTNFSANNIRSAATVDGTSFWETGANTGVVYQAAGTSGAGTIVSSTQTNLRQAEVSNGQLYVSTGSGSTYRVASVGTGTPTTTGQTLTELPPEASISGPYAFLFTTLGGGSTPDTLYVADNGNNTIDKFSISGGTYTADGTVAVPAATQGGLTGLTGETVTVGGVTEEELFATTPTNIYSVTDSGGTGTMSGSATSIATAGTNEYFRGITFAPTAAVPEPATLGVAGLAMSSLLVRRRRR